MEIEHDVKVIPIDENYDIALKQWQAEGWQIPVGMKPQAFFPLVRVKQPVSGVGVEAKLSIKDEGIGILRNGQLVQQ